jgi:hypothetical protein
MTYLDFVRGKLGSNWVVARRSPRILARYGEDVVCISKQRMRAIDKEYRALYGDPYDTVRAQMYLALVRAREAIVDNLVGDDYGVLAAIDLAIITEQERP